MPSTTFTNTVAAWLLLLILALVAILLITLLIGLIVAVAVAFIDEFKKWRDKSKHAS